MARKPNYNFERKERERLKAEKAAERTKAKAERATRPDPDSEQPLAETRDSPEPPPERV